MSDQPRGRSLIQRLRTYISTYQCDETKISELLHAKNIYYYPDLQLDSQEIDTKKNQHRDRNNRLTSKPFGHILLEIKSNLQP